MISATQIKRGMTIKLNEELYRVFSFQHITPGNWRGMVQTKLKSLRSGAIIEHRFRSEDRIEQAYLDTQEVEYLYSDGSHYHFMNNRDLRAVPFNGRFTRRRGSLYGPEHQAAGRILSRETDRCYNAGLCRAQSRFDRAGSARCYREQRQ